MAPELTFWGALLALFVAGARRAWRRRRVPRTLADGLTLSATALLALVVLIEALARLEGAPTARGRVLAGCAYDEGCGWLCKAIDGAPLTRRPRLLVVGDSFTAAAGVPESSVYYRALADDLGMELWVRAGVGWGTLQELLALDGLIDQVRPDLIVLQVCANDFINNSWELEHASIPNNNLSRRPYWEHGAVVWRNPGRGLGLAHFLATRSALATQVVVRLHRLRLALAARGTLSSVESEITTGRDAFAPWVRAQATTDELVGVLAQRVGGARVVAVPADSYEPYRQAWRTILERHRVAFCERGLARLDAAAKAAEAVRQADGAHWNERGHLYVGQALSAWLRGVPEDAAPPTAAADLEGRGGVDVVSERDSRLTVASLRGARVELRELGAIGRRQHLVGVRRVAPRVWHAALRDERSGALVSRELRDGRLVDGTTPVSGATDGPPGAVLVGFTTHGGRPCVVWYDASARRVLFRGVDGPGPRWDRSVQAELSPGAEVLGTPDLDGDGQADVAWTDPGRQQVSFWRGGERVEPRPARPADPAWTIETVANIARSPALPAAMTALVWRHASAHRRAVWYLDAAGRRVSGSVFAP